MYHISNSNNPRLSVYFFKKLQISREFVFKIIFKWFTKLNTKLKKKKKKKNWIKFDI
jgi:hypothetical protein